MTTGESLALVGLVVSLGVAVVGWWQAVRAGRRADTAGALAEAAERRAVLAEMLALESFDVHWAHERDEAGEAVVFTNIGTTTAVGVVIAIDRDGHGRVTAEAAEVPPLGQVSVAGLPKTDTVLASFSDGNTVSTRMVVPGMARVRWQTSLGRPDQAVIGC